MSSGLFICAGGVLYDRAGTRLITVYRGVAQMMPIFSILFFILCLSNCGAPLTLNFVGEFMSLYGVFERMPLLGLIASSSVVFSAAYTIYMFNRMAFGGAFFFNLKRPTDKFLYIKWCKQTWVLHALYINSVYSCIRCISCSNFRRITLFSIYINI